MNQEIKSYVLRKGRISNRQQSALNDWLADYAVTLDGTPWDWRTIFSKQQPVVVEIGFGMGASLVAMASQNPEWNYIGIEVHEAGIGSLVADIHDLGLTNVKVAVGNAVPIFKQHIPKDSLAGIQIFFPDPWHKKRHHKRRLIQPPFVSMLTASLMTSGFIHCATDWEDYAHHMLHVLSQEPSLENQAKEGFSKRPHTRPVTKFERRGVGLGHGVWDLIFTKRKLTRTV